MEGCSNGRMHSQSLQSSLLRKLVSAVSSSSLMAITTRLLSVLNLEEADQGDLSNLIINSDDQFPEVCWLLNVTFFGIITVSSRFILIYLMYVIQVVRCREAVQLAKDNLDSLIVSCRKQLGKRNLEFISVSGITHLLEVITGFYYV